MVFLNRVQGSRVFFFCTCSCWIFVPLRSPSFLFDRGGFFTYPVPFPWSGGWSGGCNTGNICMGGLPILVHCQFHGLANLIVIVANSNWDRNSSEFLPGTKWNVLYDNFHWYNNEISYKFEIFRNFVISGYLRDRNARQCTSTELNLPTCDDTERLRWNYSILILVRAVDNIDLILAVKNRKWRKNE